MGMLDHWQPAVPSKKVRKRPVAFRLCGRDLVLFRDGSGAVGALADQCVHRRMKLSQGRVMDGRLMCKYHAWTFDAQGNGESPGTPKLHACAEAFDAREYQGFVWIKSRNSDPVFPLMETDGWYQMAMMEHVAPAPLEVALDNFTEIEHTPTAHNTFGYRLDAMKDVRCRTEANDTTVRVLNSGPAKSMGRINDWAIGVKNGFEFVDDWTTHFSPIYSVYEHYWAHPVSGEESKVRWRLYMFVTPIDDASTRVTTWAFGRSRWPLPCHGGLPLFNRVMRRNLRHEIDLDVEILGGLASYDTSLEGMKLSRFDRALGLNRERIERIYRGNASPGRVALRTTEAATV